mgnify:CR=1 FL=1
MKSITIPKHKVLRVTPSELSGLFDWVGSDFTPYDPSRAIPKRVRFMRLSDGKIFQNPTWVQSWDSRKRCYYIQEVT